MGDKICTTVVICQRQPAFTSKTYFIPVVKCHGPCFSTCFSSCLKWNFLSQNFLQHKKEFEYECPMSMINLTLHIEEEHRWQVLSWTWRRTLRLPSRWMLRQTCWEMAKKDLRGSIKVVKQRERGHRWEASLQGSRVKILRSFTFFFFWNMNRRAARDQHISSFEAIKARFSLWIVKSWPVDQWHSAWIT